MLTRLLARLRKSRSALADIERRMTRLEAILGAVEDR